MRDRASLGPGPSDAGEIPVSIDWPEFLLLFAVILMGLLVARRFRRS